MAREQPVEERGADVPDVQETCRGRSHTDADGHAYKPMGGGWNAADTKAGVLMRRGDAKHRRAARKGTDADRQELAGFARERSPRSGVHRLGRKF
jgi:hypothetical protein